MVLNSAGRGWQAARDGTLRSGPGDPRLRALVVDGTRPEGARHPRAIRPVSHSLLPGAERAAGLLRRHGLRPPGRSPPASHAGPAPAGPVRGSTRERASLAVRQGRHAAGDGSFGRSAGGATARGLVLLAVAVVLGIVLLNSADNPRGTTLATGKTPPPAPPVAPPPPPPPSDTKPATVVVWIGPDLAATTVPTTAPGSTSTSPPATTAPGRSTTTTVHATSTTK